ADTAPAPEAPAASRLPEECTTTGNSSTPLLFNTMQIVKRFPFSNPSFSGPETLSVRGFRRGNYFEGQRVKGKINGVTAVGDLERPLPQPRLPRTRGQIKYSPWGEQQRTVDRALCS